MIKIVQTLINSTIKRHITKALWLTPLSVSTIIYPVGVLSRRGVKIFIGFDKLIVLDGKHKIFDLTTTLEDTIPPLDSKFFSSSYILTFKNVRYVVVESTMQTDYNRSCINVTYTLVLIIFIFILFQT